MLVPHDNERVRSFQVSGKDVKRILSAVLLVAFLLGTFTVAFFVKQGQHVRAAQLRRENELLAREVDDMRKEMETLNGSISALSKKDEQYRVMAGLPELGDDVRRAGVGGPDVKLSEQALMHLNPSAGRKVTEASTDLESLTRRASLLRASMDEALTALQRNRERLAATPAIAPANGHLSSLFSGSRFHPVLRISRPHKGIDIAARVGEPILAPARGRVRFAGNKGNGYGNMVEIDHGYGYVTRYAHASQLLVHTGQTVNRGDLIAKVGATGLVSGPHLHYEVEVDGRQVDPLNFIIADAIPD
ncbi:MAG TPA: peptidoglycan DD-metalloendopeptidase family protein [Longimicrobium sp.]|nr:peptidoglycan DD-metalloendopeptidase family protein [Longimicrobium sp.]